MAFASNVSNSTTLKNQSITNGGEQFIYDDLDDTTITDILYKSRNSSVTPINIENGEYKVITGNTPSSSIIAAVVSQNLHTDDYLSNVTSGGVQIVYTAESTLKTQSNTTYSLGTAAYSGTTNFSAQNATIYSGGAMQVYSAPLPNLTTSTASNKITVYSSGNPTTVTFKSGGKLNLKGNMTIPDEIDLKGATVTVSGQNNRIASPTMNSKTTFNFDIKSITSSNKASNKPSAAALTFDSSVKLNGKITVQTNDYNKWGNYLFVGNATIPNKANVTLKIGKKSLTLPYHSQYKNVTYKWYHGNNFVLHGANSGYITLSIWGTWHTRKHTGNTLTKNSDGYYHISGTSGNDMIYAAAKTVYNDKVILSGGSDVVVYDKAKWGKDIIQKGKGGCILLFKDLKAADVSKKLAKGTMTITKKSDKKQSITIKGWSNKTDKIVYSSGLNAINKYISAATPTNGICTSAYNEAFKKVGLAKCTVRQS